MLSPELKCLPSILLLSRVSTALVLGSWGNLPYDCSFGNSPPQVLIAKP